MNEALRASGLSAVAGEWNPRKPPNCRAAAIIATGDIGEIEREIGSAVWQGAPVLVLEFEKFGSQGNIRNYLAKAPVINCVSRSLDECVRDLMTSLSLRLKPTHEDRGKHLDRWPAPTPPPESRPDERASGQLSSLPKPPKPLASVIGLRRSEPTQRSAGGSPRVRSGAIKTSQAESAPPEFVGLPASAHPTFQMPSNGILADAKPLKGFFSYSRVDDRGSENTLSKLRDKIESQLHMQLGRKVELWQDTSQIRVGARWQNEIKSGISNSSFFIPVVTPNSIESPSCAFEFKAFCEQEQAIGRTDLVFPIIFIDVWSLRPKEYWAKNEIRTLVAERQYVDLSELNELPFDDVTVRRRIRKFCENIAEALQMDFPG